MLLFPTPKLAVSREPDESPRVTPAADGIASHLHHHPQIRAARTQRFDRAWAEEKAASSRRRSETKLFSRVCNSQGVEKLCGTPWVAPRCPWSTVRDSVARRAQLVAQQIVHLPSRRGVTPPWSRRPS